MAGYKMLRHTLDTLFETMDVNSWTLHENKNSSVITVRFCNMDGETKMNPKTTAFRKKSQKQLDRDRQRCQRLNRPNTLSRTNLDGDNEEIENPRHVDDLDLELHSNLDISIVSAESVPPESPFQPSDSPSPPLLSPVQSNLADSHVDEPLLVQPDETVPADMDCNTPAVAGAEAVTPLFREHVIHRNKSWATMYCHDCRTNVNKAAGSSPKRRMTYCANCELYFCEDCLRREPICYCNSTPSFIT